MVNRNTNSPEIQQVIQFISLGQTEQAKTLITSILKKIPPTLMFGMLQVF